MTPAAASATTSGQGRAAYQRIADAIAGAASVSYSATITITGIPGLTGARLSGYATPSAGYRVEVLHSGKQQVGLLESEWYEGRAYLYGTEGGLVVAGLGTTRAAAEAGRWIVAPTHGIFATRLAETLPLGKLLAPYGPSGPVRLLGTSVLGGHDAIGVASASVGGQGGTFRLWASDARIPLPLRATARLVGVGSDLDLQMRFTHWDTPKALSPPPDPVEAATGWWAGAS